MLVSTLLYAAVAVGGGGRGKTPGVFFGTGTLPGAGITGPPASAYDWETEHCPGVRGDFETGGRCAADVLIGCDPDVPDAPLKAFRNSSGSVVVLASCDLGSRALIGPSLASAKHTCGIYMNSTLDYKMADSADREWIQSPWAFKNGSIYALTHMEYHNRSNQAGLWSAVTLLKSVDGGVSWQHARAPPHHIVAASPFKYEGPTSTPLFGFRSPSNILQDREQSDGLYYAFLSAGWGTTVRGQPTGTCIMRTNDLTDPASWRAWDGASFNVSLAVNPYTHAGKQLDPARHRCAPVTKMTYISLLWSSFFQQYMAVGTSKGNDHLGWSFQLTANLADPGSWSNETAIATNGFVQPEGNATRREMPSPVPGIFARSGEFATQLSRSSRCYSNEWINLRAVCHCPQFSTLDRVHVGSSDRESAGQQLCVHAEPLSTVGGVHGQSATTVPLVTRSGGSAMKTRPSTGTPSAARSPPAVAHLSPRAPSVPSTMYQIPCSRPSQKALG